MPLDAGGAAEILAPLHRCEGALHLLLTRRPDHLLHHAGEICFPGGGVDPPDSDDGSAALRETQEEIGVAPDLIEPLGRLDDCYSNHRYRGSCHVGLLPAERSLSPSSLSDHP